ncbi:MAG: CYCXC family (seleno)protein [Candidatus Binataceae bacterium]
MKHKGLVFTAGVLALGAALIWPAFGSRFFFGAAEGSRAPMCHGGHCCCAMGHGGEAMAAQSRPTLDPNQFTGKIKTAYEAAAANPALFMQLHCYCGCDITAGHKNLLDCYRDFHGATCAICTGEALMAHKMNAEGSPVQQIRDALRDNFANRE